MGAGGTGYIKGKPVENVENIPGAYVEEELNAREGKLIRIIIGALGIIFGSWVLINIKSI